MYFLAHRDRMRGNSLTLRQGRFRLDIVKEFLHGGGCEALPREVIEVKHCPEK